MCTDDRSPSCPASCNHKQSLREKLWKKHKRRQVAWELTSPASSQASCLAVRPYPAVLLTPSASCQSGDSPVWERLSEQQSAEQRARAETDAPPIIIPGGPPPIPIMPGILSSHAISQKKLWEKHKHRQMAWELTSPASSPAYPCPCPEVDRRARGPAASRRAACRFSASSRSSRSCHRSSSGSSPGRTAGSTP